MKKNYTGIAAGVFSIFLCLVTGRFCLAYDGACKVTQQAGTVVGYDTNPAFSPTRKGDIFEEAMYSLAIVKPLTPEVRVTLNYDFDTRHYNEITDASFLLHHLRLGLHERFAPFTVGGGYDGGYVFGGPSLSPDNDDSFLLHKAFLYIKQDLTKKIFHQLEGEYGYKDYTDQKALGDNLLSSQDKERADTRFGVEYSVGSILSRRAWVLARAKFWQNDSNARYLDFYDYNAYQFASSLDYLLLKDLHLVSQFRYIRTNYSSRTVTLQDFKQRDNFYIGNVSLKYALDKHNTLSVYYTYRTNKSNEPLEEFSESVIGSGWQYSF
jgi:hypothetical protein